FRSWHQRVALALDGADEAVQLAAVQEQLARARRVGIDVRRGGGQRCDVRAEQPGLAVPQVNVALGELRPPGTQAFHLPAFQGEAGLEGPLDEIIVPRLAVDRDEARRLRRGGGLRHFESARAGAAAAEDYTVLSGRGPSARIAARPGGTCMATERTRTCATGERDGRHAPARERQVRGGRRA